MLCSLPILGDFRQLWAQKLWAQKMAFFLMTHVMVNLLI
jgi:hypothetical protein